MSLRFLVCLFLLLPAPLLAQEGIEALEEIARQRHALQPGLERYSARLVSDKITELQHALAASGTAQAPSVAPPLLVSCWERHRRGQVVPGSEQPDEAGRRIADYFNDTLLTDVVGALVPDGHQELRRTIAGQATLKTADTSLGETLIRRIELTFPQPVSLEEAFYSRSLPLPQERVSRIYFDIDAGNRTIQEIGLLTADDLKLTLEIRYHEVPGGYLPERIKATSPDGRIDDLLEIRYETIDGFTLPTQLTRVVRRPGKQEQVLVTFNDHRVNRPFPPVIRDRFEGRP